MAIQFYLTSAGKNAALNATSLGLNVSLTHIAVGTGKYDPSNALTLTNTSLVSELERYPLNGGSVEPVSHTLRFVANLEPTLTADAFEIGLITDQGVLFAVAATTSNTPLIRLVANIVAIVTFGMILSNLNLSNLIINVDPNTPISVALMNQHLDSVDPHPQYATKSLVHSLIDLNVDNAVDYLVSLLNLHQTGINPHPQYLLASTFGVDLQMKASVNTPITEENCVFGWNGESGATAAFHKTPKWWVTHDETVTFKPFRAYGQFLLNIQFQPEGDGTLAIAIFNKDDVKIAEDTILSVSSTSFNQLIKHVFYLNKGEYAKVRIYGRVWNENWGHFSGSIYVDDRVKVFSPVGFQSTVDFANTIEDGSVSVETPLDYSTFSSAEWSYFDSGTELNVALSASTTFATPESHTPHYHRALFATNPNTELWIVIEVGKQLVETPSDYAAVEAKVIRGSTDVSGNIVIQIPFSMRTVATPNNETLIYRVAYYLAAVTKTLADPFPSSSIDGIHEFFAEIS